MSMDKTLNNNDFCRASKKLRCEVAAIKAVAHTESLGKGFYGDGFPVILFERHIFRKYTGGRYNRTHPHLSGPAGNYGAAGQNQRNKFNEAFALDPQAAMMSCSWGKFQIMGFNYAICGFKSVGAFVDAMKESEGRQLDAFVAFVIHNGLDKYLRTLNWAAFAKGYNGSGYKKNKYDTKMATAYTRFKKEELDCGSLKLVDKTVSSRPTGGGEDEIPTEISNEGEDKGDGEDIINNPVDGEEEPKPGEATPDAPAEEGQPVVGGRPGDDPKQVPSVDPKETSGLGAWVANIRAQWAAAGIGFPALGSLAFLTNPLFIKIAIGIIVFCLFGALVSWITTMVIKSVEKRAREREAHELTLKQMELAADPTKYNVEVVKGEK